MQAPNITSTFLSFLTLLILSCIAAKAEDSPEAPVSLPMIVKADEVQYPAVQKGPGLQIATLHGDTKKTEPFTLRIKWPRCYVVPSH